MKPFVSGFIGGIILAAAVIVLVPMLAEDMSPVEAIARMTNKPHNLALFAEMFLGSGFIFGLLFQFLAWIGRKNKQNDETNELMREYLKKKLQEENDKQD